VPNFTLVMKKLASGRRGLDLSKKEAEEGSYPFVAALGFRDNSSGQTTFDCGGTLVLILLISLLSEMFLSKFYSLIFVRNFIQKTNEPIWMYIPTKISD
jgi:hypothetical protein